MKNKKYSLGNFDLSGCIRNTMTFACLRCVSLNIIGNLNKFNISVNIIEKGVNFFFLRINNHNVNQKLIKILKSEFIEIENSNYNGLLQTENKERLKIQVNGGIIFLKEIQLEGKRKMKTEEFLKGFLANFAF